MKIDISKIIEINYLTKLLNELFLNKNNYKLDIGWIRVNNSCLIKALVIYFYNNENKFIKTLKFNNAYDINTCDKINEQIVRLINQRKSIYNFNFNINYKYYNEFTLERTIYNKGILDVKRTYN